MRRRAVNHAMILVGAGLAFWPVWVWYVRRMTDGSDEPWGLAALAAAVTIWFFGGRREMRPNWTAAAFTVAVYVLAFRVLPDLAKGVLAMSALAALTRTGRGAAGRWGLLVLSLPVMATVQFYAGYPLRRLATEGAVFLLRTVGIDVTAAGTVLHWRGELIAVDAPCSGITMLWGGLFLACVLCAWFQTGFAATALSGALAAVIVIAANTLRAAALFIKETGIVALPSWTHEGIGIVLFAAAALLVSILCQKLERVFESAAETDEQPA